MRASIKLIFYLFKGTRDKVRNRYKVTEGCMYTKVAWCEVTEGEGGCREEIYNFLTPLMQAYDSVDRGVLWLKLKRMGFGGAFLRMVQVSWIRANLRTVGQRTVVG